MSKPTKRTKLSPANDQEQIGEIKATLEYLKEDFGLMREEIRVMNQTLSVSSQTLAVNTKQLEIHIEGVKLAREQNEILKKDVDNKFETVSIALRPIQEHVTRVNFLGKLTLAFVGAPAAIYYIAQIIRMLMGKI